MMYRLIKIGAMGLILFSVLLAAVASAADNIERTWEGKLALGEGSSLTVQFVLTKAEDGSLTALLNSPDQGGIKNLPASSASLTNNVLAIEVPDLNGSYKGTVDGEVITGEWVQEGTTFPLVLKPFVEKMLSAADIDRLAGRWEGQISNPVRTVTVVFRFEKNSAGDLQSYFDSPDEGATGIPVDDVKVEGENVVFQINRAQVKYTGTLKDGRVTGQWSQGGGSVELNLTRKDADPSINALAFSADVKKKLQGTWYGNLTIPAATITSVVRFETDENGFFKGYYDSPDRGRTDLPITEATFADNNLKISVPGVAVEYTATLADKTLTGKLVSQGQTFPLTLTAGDLPDLVLDLPPDAVRRLAGQWKGELRTPRGTSTLTFRFEESQPGKLSGFVDNATQGVNGARISAATLTDGKLTLTAAGLNLQYEGDLSGTDVQGKLSAGNQSFDVALAKSN